MLKWRWNTDFFVEETICFGSKRSESFKGPPPKTFLSSTFKRGHEQCEFVGFMTAGLRKFEQSGTWEKHTPSSTKHAHDVAQSPKPSIRHKESPKYVYSCVYYVYSIHVGTVLTRHFSRCSILTYILGLVCGKEPARQNHRLGGKGRTFLPSFPKKNDIQALQRWSPPCKE